MIVDFHAHCYPDLLAAKALPKIARAAGIAPALDGTLVALRGSMAHAGIDLCIVQHIATRPGQEPTINQWAAAIQGPGILSFGTIHPASPAWRDEVRRLADLGLRGIKFHPDHQGFFAADPAVFPLYEELCRAGLVILFHAGVDLALPDPCHCPPVQLREVIDRYPEGRWVAAHLGGYLLWDKMETCLLGRPIHLDTSYTFHQLGADGMKKLIKAHGTDRILFGTDTP